MILRLLLLVFTPVFLLSASETESPPNVILILADDMGLGDLASLNGGINRTPHLDSLKSESLWFSKAYSSSPVCAPARAALLTGRFPHRTGAVTLNMEKHPKMSRIKLDEKTMGDVFRANGYTTGLIGKWHSGTGENYHPLSRGFDEFTGFIGHLYVPSYFDFKLDIQRTQTEFKDDYLTDELSERAIQFVRKHRQGPFFLHLAHYAPHRPIEAPEEAIQRYIKAGHSRERATVYAMIEIMDKGIGNLLDELARLELRERTLVIFASDNGPDPLVEERFNLDLRGAKYQVHEGGIRVPLFWNWPGQINPGENKATIDFTDILPTLIELCDLEWEPPLPLDGTSFCEVIIDDVDPPERPRFWQWNRSRPLYSHNAAIRDGNWKMVRPFVTKNYPKGPSELTPLLFNLSHDPAEAEDIADRHPDRAKNMDQLLEAWTIDVERSRVRHED